jgi:hypothetical protein
VEYYDVLIKDGTTRRVTFEWPGGMVVDAFSVAFQNPTGATNLSIDPEPVQNQRDQFNLLNYITKTVSLSAGEAFKLTAQYEKANDDLSVSGLPVQPSVPLEQTSGQVVWSDILPWVIGGLGLGLIVLGLMVLFSFLRGGNRSGRRSKERRERNRHASQSEAKDDKDDAVYCHECGHRAQPGDVFCRTCGARLRRDE